MAAQGRPGQCQRLWGQPVLLGRAQGELGQSAGIGRGQWLQPPDRGAEGPRRVGQVEGVGEQTQARAGHGQQAFRHLAQGCQLFRRQGHLPTGQQRPQPVPDDQCGRALERPFGQFATPGEAAHSLRGAGGPAAFALAHGLHTQQATTQVAQRPLQRRAAAGEIGVDHPGHSADAYQPARQVFGQRRLAQAFAAIDEERRALARTDGALQRGQLRGAAEKATGRLGGQAARLWRQGEALPGGQMGLGDGGEARERGRRIMGGGGGAGVGPGQRHGGRGQGRARRGRR
jgi:hypothetical protein